MFPNRHPPGKGGGAGGDAFLSSLDRLRDEYTSMQNQLSAQRNELDKMNADKEMMQRQYAGYYEMANQVNMEMHKQAELARRFQTILTSIIQYVPADQQQAAVNAMDRAKQISMNEVAAQLATSQASQAMNMMGGMLGGPMAAMNPMAAMAAAMGGGNINPAAMAAMMNMVGGAGAAGPRPLGMDGERNSNSRQSSRQRSSSPAEKKPKVEDADDDLIDVQNDDPATSSTAINGKNGRESVGSNSSSKPPRNPLNPLDPQALLAMTAGMMQNGKPAYSFTISAGKPIGPTQFPEEVLKDPEVPKTLVKLHDLPHGEVVCAVTISSNSRNVFTGGKGCVKVWDINTAGGSSGASSSSTSSTSPLAPVTSLECLKDNYIRSCKLFEDNTRLVVGGEAACIALWDVETKTLLKELDTGAQACYALALNPETRQLFACCADGNIVIWDLRNNEKVGVLPGHVDGASCVDLANDGVTLWSGGLDNILRSWDLRQKEVLSSVTFNSQIFSLGCSPKEDWVAVGMENQIVEVVNTKTTSERYQLHKHESCVLSLKFAHSGKWFSTTGKDNVINTWQAPFGALAVRAQESSSVLSCDISHDDAFLVTGSGEKKATVYQVQYDSPNISPPI